MESSSKPDWLKKLKVIFPKWLFWIVAILLVGIFNEFARTGLPEARRVGHHADLAVMLFILSAILLFQIMPKWIGRGLTAFTMLLLTVFTIVNWWFFAFYRDYLTPSTLKLAIYAEESVMAWDGLLYKSEAFMFLVSIMIACLILFRLDRYKPGVKSLLIGALVFLALGCYKQYQVGPRVLGGMQHKGTNHITHFLLNFAPLEVIKFTEQDLQKIESVFPYKNFAGDIDYPLFQNKIKSSQPAKRNNVLLIVMESVRAAETGVNKAIPYSVTPNLDAIAAESLTAAKAYSNANQTVRSEFSILCSALDYVDGAPYAHLGVPINTACIPAVLAEYGYQTYWIHGYKKSFYNRDEFFPSLGFREIHDKAFIEQQGVTEQLGWGIADNALFEYTLSVLEKSEKPFFAEVLTLSNHFPYLWDWGIDFPDELQLPANIKETKTEAAYPAYRRGIYYTDYQLGKFWQAFKNSPLYDNTLVIITGDHGIWTFPAGVKENQSFGAEMHKNEVYFRTPLVFHAPDLKPGEIDGPASHADIAPTILDYLGIDYPNAFIGESVIDRGDYTYPVYFLAAGGFGVRRGDLYCYPVDTSGLCTTYNRKCKNYQSSDTGTQCVVTKLDLLNKIQPFDWAEHDLSSDRLLVRMTQQALNTRFLPGGVEAK